MEKKLQFQAPRIDTYDAAEMAYEVAATFEPSPG